MLARWRERTDSEINREPTEQSFCVPRAEIAANDYELNINRYKEVVKNEIEHIPPLEILDEIATLEEEIREGLDDLRTMLE